MIATWAITLITFLMGYALGSYAKNPEPINNATKRLKRKIKGTKLGAVNRLTPQEMMIQKNPKLKEEEEAMTEVLDDVLPRV